MKKRLTSREIHVILSEMQRAEDEHPKAKVLFDIELKEILITYPLPQDFIKVSDWEKGSV